MAILDAAEREARDEEAAIHSGADHPEASGGRSQLTQGQTVGQAVKKLGITEQTYYRWRKDYGGLRLDQAKRLRSWRRRTAG